MQQMLSGLEKIDIAQTRKAVRAKVTVAKGLSYSLQIDTTFGSDFQRTVAVRNLNRLLEMWKSAVETRHRKNAITVIAE
jgi:hypothetical protein